MKEQYSMSNIKTNYKRFYYLSIALLIWGVCVLFGSFIYSLAVRGDIELLWAPFMYLCSLGAVIICAGLILRYMAIREGKNILASISKSPVTLKTIILSYALVNDNPLKNIDDLHFYLQTEGISNVSMIRLKQMVKRAENNVKVDIIKGPLKSTLFTRDGKVRKYQYGADYCPKCGIFKNYHKECSFCDHHEMAD